MWHGTKLRYAVLFIKRQNVFVYEIEMRLIVRLVVVVGRRRRNVGRVVMKVVTVVNKEVSRGRRGSEGQHPVTVVIDVRQPVL